MTTVKKEYLYIDPNKLTRSLQHSNTFLPTEESDYSGTSESYLKHGRCNPVYFIERTEENIFQPINAVIDGWKYVMYAQSNGIEEVFACKLTFEEAEDITKIMVQLQFSNHNTLSALFQIIMQLWPIYAKGQGHRSDLQESERDNDSENKELNIYGKIGKELGISGNKVKHIRKVGMVNPLFFERIENSRFSLYAAYLECVKEEAGEMPEPPSIKPPVYFTNSTEVPQFSEPTLTSSHNGFEIVTDECEVNNDIENAEEYPPVKPVEPEYIQVRGTCTCCGQETEIRIKRGIL